MSYITKRYKLQRIKINKEITEFIDILIYYLLGEIKVDLSREYGYTQGSYFNVYDAEKSI